MRKMQAGILLQCGVSGRCWADWQGGPFSCENWDPNALLFLMHDFPQHTPSPCSHPPVMWDVARYPRVLAQDH